MSKAVAVLMIAVLALAASCAPSALTPTSTPQPTATPIEVRATEPVHLEGIWWCRGDVGDYHTYGGPYYRWDAEGTVWWADDADFTMRPFSARYWFEDGLYHEDESHLSIGVGIYEIYLEIEEGRAVGMRMERIREGAPPHPQVYINPRSNRYRFGFSRAD